MLQPMSPKNTDVTGPQAVGSVDIVAGNEIPAGVLTGPFDGPFRLGHNLRNSPKTVIIQKVHYENCSIQGKSNWMRFVRPARDRHEQNIEVVRNPHGHIFFRTLRTVKSDEPLLAWYSEEFGREFGIPVLTPFNIRGDQNYVCTNCKKVFKYPNTLKSHIFFRCAGAQKTMSPLPYQETDYKQHRQIGVAKCIQQEPSPDRKMIKCEEMPISPPRGPKDLTTGSNSAFRPAFPRLSPVSSTADSFSPFQSPLKESVSPKLDEKSESSSSTSLYPMIPGLPQPIQIFNHIHPSPFAMPPFAHAPSALKYYMPFYPNPMHQNGLFYPMGPQSFPPRFYPGFDPLLQFRMENPSKPGQSSRSETPASFDSRDEVDGEHMAQKIPFPLPSEKAGEPLDLIPRSLYISKSRKGHLCIYCGKLYSRKYGLKIHLRTHTGYKPLKCKVCLRPFGDPSNLNKHIRLHAEGDTPYRCEYCGKVLVRRRDLERHIKSRHPAEAEKIEREKMLKNCETNSNDEVEDCLDDADDDIDVVQD